MDLILAPLLGPLSVYLWVFVCVCEWQKCDKCWNGEDVRITFRIDNTSFPFMPDQCIRLVTGVSLPCFSSMQQNEVTDSAYLGSESTYSECETFTDEDTGALVPPEMHEDVETDSGIEATLHDPEDASNRWVYINWKVKNAGFQLAGSSVPQSPTGCWGTQLFSDLIS